MQQRAHFLTMSAILVAVFWVQQTTAKCGECSEFGFACLNETAFTRCTNGLPDLLQVRNCASGSCTATNVVCSTGVADCQTDLSKCGSCASGQLHTCMSRSTYAICSGGVPLTTRDCPPGKVCTTDPGSEFCVSSCSLLHDPECNIDP